MRNCLFTILLLFFSCACLFSQEIDSSAQTAIDSSNSIDSIQVKKVKKPRKLQLKPIQVGAMSAILPGAGQIYNRKWWKLPLVYGGMGGVSYLIYANTKEYRRFKTAYAAKLAEEEVEPALLGLSAQSLKNIRDRYQKNMEMSYLGAIGVFLLVGVDAYIDAHMAGFDVSDDLTFKIKPIYPGDPYLKLGKAQTLSFTYTF